MSSRNAESSRRRLDGFQPRLAWVLVGAHPALLEQVVLDLLEDQCVDVLGGLGPVGRLPRLQRDELELQPGRLGSLEDSLGGVGQLLASGLDMLQLVVRQVLDLAEIALGHQLEVGPALIAGQLLVDDLPADVAGREHVADARRVGPVAPHRADLLVAVGMPEGEPIARGLRDGTAVLERFDEPVAAVEPNDGARRERVLSRVLPPMLSAGAVDRDDLVGGGHGVQLTR
jgi:hypothetical protein